MEPKHILFWVIPQYMYRWGLSKVYIDILYADDIITQYDSPVEKDKDGNVKYDPDGQRKADEAMERWYKEHPELRPKETVNLNDLMSEK